MSKYKNHKRYDGGGWGESGLILGFSKGKSPVKKVTLGLSFGGRGFPHREEVKKAS